MYGFLFAFHVAVSLLFSRFDTIHERDRHQTDRHHTTAKAALIHSIVRQKLIAARMAYNSERDYDAEHSQLYILRSYMTVALPDNVHSTAPAQRACYVTIGSARKYSVRR